MLADPELTVFRSYRAYDDFERIALHGTFLIDPAGLVDAGTTSAPSHSWTSRS